MENKESPKQIEELVNRFFLEASRCIDISPISLVDRELSTALQGTAVSASTWTKLIEARNSMHTAYLLEFLSGLHRPEIAPIIRDQLPAAVGAERVILLRSLAKWDPETALREFETLYRAGMVKNQAARGMDLGELLREIQALDPMTAEKLVQEFWPADRK